MRVNTVQFDYDDCCCCLRFWLSSLYSLDVHISFRYIYVHFDIERNIYIRWVVLSQPNTINPFFCPCTPFTLPLLHISLAVAHSMNSTLWISIYISIWIDVKRLQHVHNEYDVDDGDVDNSSGSSDQVLSIIYVL